jgi:hypothetical protein
VGRARNEVLAAARDLSPALFEHALMGAPVARLGAADAPTNVFVNVYPLNGKPSLPRRS